MAGARIHVSLVAIPEAVMSSLSGIYDALNSFGSVASEFAPTALPWPFEVEIVGETAAPVMLASGLPASPHRAIDEIAETDIVIVPSVLVSGESWAGGRYPALVDWVTAMHGRGAVLCSACSGIFLLAETGLFDGRQASVHWAYADKFRRSFPQVPVTPERVLVIDGEHRQLISSGASTSWHDLVLYLVSTHIGPSTALAVARFFAMEWHREGLAPYIVFSPRRDHGDAAILNCQDWLADHYSLASPVDEMVKRSGLTERTFKRRFTAATGLAPIAYVQHLRIEQAKRGLEDTDLPIDEIGWKVGYEEAAFFRRLFKRFTGLTPGAYRRKFRLPGFAQHS